MNKPSRVGVLCLGAFVALLVIGLWRYTVARARPDRGGWGIDACLTTHVTGALRAGYLDVLGSSGVGWLRERQLEASMRSLHRDGYQVVAFTHFPGLEPKRPGNQLHEDLRNVFHAGKFAQEEAGTMVDAWEMVGEADLGFSTDLPDRVAAYQKALYLGLKAGAAEAKRKPETGNLKPEDSDNGLGTQSPIVLMGALGMPPGPWLERAAANGLLDYTDAYNFHFYGHGADLTGVIQAHREAIRRLGVKRYELDGTGTSNVEHLTSNFPHSAMPIWITECGIEAVDKKDFLNPQRRQLQADFTISTAKQALAAEDVAVFMPFILVHDNDPYAMTVSADKPLPAWTAYAKFTRDNPWPKRPLTRERMTDGGRPRADDIAVSPVVLQWLPDNHTTVPHKVAGTYRFRGNQPIKGELRVYNFGEQPAKGRIEQGALKHVRVMLGAKGEGQRADDGRRTAEGEGQTADGGGRTTEDRGQGADSGDQSSDGGRQTSDVRIPAMGMVAVPLEFTATTGGYFRETFTASFVEEKPQVSGFRSQVSRVSFGLAAWAKLADFTEEPVPLRPMPNGVIQFPQIEPYAPGEQVGVWTTMNGLRAEDGGQTSDSRGQTASEGHQSSAISRQISDIGHKFWIEKENTDPLAPTLAVAAIDGLPVRAMDEGQKADIGRRTADIGHQFLRLQLDKPMTKDRKVLVVLVDDRGQRYSIWENFGADYYGSRSDVWLNLQDIHADFWGPMSADYQFRPERIREVHLRLYLSTPNDPVGVELTLLKAKSMEHGAK